MAGLDIVSCKLCFSCSNCFIRKTYIIFFWFSIYKVRNAACVKCVNENSSLLQIKQAWFWQHTRRQLAWNDHIQVLHERCTRNICKQSTLKIALFILSGKKYIFDIQRTFREAYDHARRQLYRAEMATRTEGTDTSDWESEADSCQQQPCPNSNEYMVSTASLHHRESKVLCRPFVHLICFSSKVLWSLTHIWDNSTDLFGELPIWCKIVLIHVNDSYNCNCQVYLEVHYILHTCVVANDNATL